MAGRRLVYLSLETPLPGQAAHTHVHEIVRNLRDFGWSVDLVVSASGGASANAGYLKRLIGYLGCYARSMRALGQADALYVRAHFAAWPVAALAQWRGMPVIHEINGKPADFAVTYPSLAALAPLVTWLYRSQFAKAAHLIAVTDGLKDWAAGFAGHQRVTVVANAADTRLFTPEGPKAEGHGRHVAFIGGLVAWHGIATMLAALDDPAWPEGVRLVVAGDGIERSKLEAMRGHPRLTWLGRVPQEALPPLLRGAVAALCVISDPDGRSATGVAPLKLFEAMAAGAPVIVSDLPFQADLVRAQQAGLVVPADDPVALARAVAALAAAPDEASAMGRRGASYAAQHASWRQRAEATAAILEVASHG